MIRKMILHPSVFLDDKGCEIDIYVLPICMRLWGKGVKTYASCQGGPGYSMNNKFSRDMYRAYVVVRKVDIVTTLRVLNKLGLDPKVDNDLDMDDKETIAIRFDPSEEAKNIPLVVMKTEITYSLKK